MHPFSGNRKRVMTGGTKSRLKIVFVSSEVDPLAKTGGLADVAGALPAALADLGHDVTVILPAYYAIDRAKYPLLSKPGAIEVPVGGKSEWGGLLTSNVLPGVTVYLVDHPGYFGRKGLYGEGGIDYRDNDERFAFFSRAIVELIRREKEPPDIIHCNDWQTALVPVYSRSLYADDPILDRSRVVFTIHNMAYQGLFTRDALARIDLPRNLFATEEGLEFYGGISFLKGGIIFSDLITTVSPTYSREIQTAEYGNGLQGVLSNRSDSLHGVLNGIDVLEWNPAIDACLPCRILPGSWREKDEAKRALMEKCGLKYSKDSPVIGVVSRLAGQKGFDLVAGACERMMKADVSFVILGVGEKRYERFFLKMMGEYPERVSVNLAFDNRLAHMIYGGSDIFLMPSRYEPCGLGQMIAMRYGTVPLARKTGGLADTIRDQDGARNGFLFRSYQANALLRAFYRALKAFQDKRRWHEIMRNGMEGDYSWSASGRRYVELYESTIARRRSQEVMI